MTQALATGDRYLTDFRAFEGSLPAKEPQWLQQIRREAWARFFEMGFPTARRGNERWKYTNVGPIADSAFEYPLEGRPEVAPGQIREIVPGVDGWARMVFVNGHYAQTLSTSPAVDGIRVANLAEAVVSDRDLLERHLARHATFEDEAFTALNTAFLQDGAFIHVPEGDVIERPLHLIFVTADDGRPIASYPRTLVVAGRHSELTVIESYVGLASGQYFTDAVTEIVLGDGAQVEHYRLLLESGDSFHVGMGRVHQGKDSTFTSTAFAKGTAVARNDLQVQLDAPGSSCFLHGLYITSGKQHLDNYINIDHIKPHTTSRLYYRGILGGQSRAVFGGTVFVRPGAVKADAHQEDKNLLLSEEAEVDSKPSLEIYADDVRCGHGATAGSVAEDALFYMRSRGLDLETATLYLIQGFASEILKTVQVAPLRAYLEGLTAEALPELISGQGS